MFFDKYSAEGNKSIKNQKIDEFHESNHRIKTISYFCRKKMSEEIFITKNADKNQIYIELIPQIESLIAPESDIIANLANITAALKEAFGWFWIGFYLVKDNQLVLGPFQGTVACSRIAYGKGVCGTSWKNATSLLVPDVNLFPGHIACSSLSVSEIVVPLINQSGEVVGVLDVDSNKKYVLDHIDILYLEKISEILTKKHY